MSLYSDLNEVLTPYAQRIKGLAQEHTELKADLEDLDGRVEALEEGGSGGLTKTAVNLINTILSEAVYGSDQTANIELLHKELANVKPISISAVLTGRALVGIQYSELAFELTLTFDDESTSTATDGYRVTTTGAVHSGQNTVTVSYRGVTTNVTFTSEEVVTHTITYNLTNISSSNVESVVVDGAYYSTNLSVKTDCDFDNCTVTMGGVDITSSVYGNLEILIHEVTDDVVITASAQAITVIDDFIYHDDTLSRVYPMEGEGERTIASLYIDNGLLYGKHDVAKETNVRICITNSSDAEMYVGAIYVGEIPAPGDYTIGDQVLFMPTKSSVVLFNSRKISNQSNTISAGGSIVANYTVHAGRRLAIYITKTKYYSLDVKVSGGAYEVIDRLYGYTAINWTKGTYDVCTYYEGVDASSTLLHNDGHGEEYTTQALSDVGKYKLMRYSETSFLASTYFGFVSAPGTSATRTEMEAFNSIFTGSILSSAYQNLLKCIPYVYDITSIDGYYLYTQYGGALYYKEAAE